MLKQIIFNNLSMAFLSLSELNDIGFASFGENVLVSAMASIYFPERINLGNNVRIDDFSIISAAGGVKIGDYVHISPYSAIYGGSGVELSDYSGLSPRCILFSESDDFSGESLVHPFFPEKYKPTYIRGKISLQKFAQLGCGTTVMPNCLIAEGSVTGAHSLVTKSLDPWGIYAGCPVRRLRNRSRMVEQHARAFEGQPSEN